MGRTRTRTPGGLVLDTGALIALERGDKRMIALLQQALLRGLAFRVPAGVVGQVWRDGRVQATLSRFLRSDEVEIFPLDGQLARACGELCGATNTRDVIDASVVMLARERRDPIVTSDTADLLRLDPGAKIIVV
ncbi:MAG: type II toxin-antitoxin system VapC family toxin [Acidobacteria bacterium]|nr:type II toxin-antitoxin system VapC family toxin [Acidobacteriota bacterium]